MTVGQTIKMCRKDKGMTQGELAALIGVSVQAVSKWETDSGMPDISQIVPLAKVLDVTTDKLLGMTEPESEEDIKRFAEFKGYHKVSFMAGEAETIYNEAVQYFSSHPTNSEVAFLCLESLTELYAEKHTEITPEQFVSECERYESSIFRYETDADQICKTYFVMSRVYSLTGDAEKSAEMLEKVPVVFGDRTYWEAEYAYLDNNTELALQKCKKSFAVKARYISRCIRLARMISEKSEGSAGLEYQVELNEYMLRIINAFLSGGDYIPNRQLFQKTSLLCMMVSQYTTLGNFDRALDCAKQLVEARDSFLASRVSPHAKHSLLFPETTDLSNVDARAELDGYVQSAESCLKTFPQYHGME